MWKTHKYKIPRHEFLHAVGDYLETIPVLELPPIPEETDMDMLQSTSRWLPRTKIFVSYLTHPTQF